MKKTTLVLCLTLAGCASTEVANVPRPTPSGPSNVVAFAGPTLGMEKLDCRASQEDWVIGNIELPACL